MASLSPNKNETRSREEKMFFASRKCLQKGAWSKKNSARIFLTGDFLAAEEVDDRELEQARERAEVA